MECSSTISCWSGLVWYIQATPEPTSTVLIICILHHAFSAHLFYCTFVHCQFLHFAPVFAVADHRDQDPPVAYYPLEDVATYLSRSRSRHVDNRMGNDRTEDGTAWANVQATAVSYVDGMQSLQRYRGGVISINKLQCWYFGLLWTRRDRRRDGICCN